METAEQLRDRLILRFPAAKVTLVSNLSPSAQHSLLVDSAHARDIATFLRDDEALRLDYCSNATGVDWPDREIIETVKAKITAADGSVQEVEQKTKRIEPGCLEVVYHLYSMARKQGPVVLRVRTANRTDQVTLLSLTPVWRSCEFQEREIFDLFGVVFEGHPDLRRILMWDEFKDHPMRKDYVEPDDYEWEPTPHGEILAKAKKHYPEAAVASPAPTEGPKP
ncbi:MAG TPA: NADH-quinone oxidoreductase subunit C [Opitutaceae bacterium]|jgi:NADH-quinone oxidoreductase subunit C|nr:NADH-quinone oxidoreductase subunit C [Opitutaceae bacterium]